MAGVKQGMADRVVERMNRLQEAGHGGGELLGLTERVLYFVMDRGDRATRTNMLAFCDRLRNAVQSDSSKAQASRLELDACFMAEDYGRALAIVEAGVPNWEKSWPSMLIPKIKAHQALAEGRKEDAIRLFREFTDRVRAGGEDFTDPVSGTRVGSHYVLGLNAARIGDIWVSLGQTNRAGQAYAEARANYRQALEVAKRDDRERQQISEAMSRLPPAAK
jgi:tetratricopeptide (TPR) repeat protein